MDKKKVVFPKTKDGKLDNEKFLEMMKITKETAREEDNFLLIENESHLEDIFLKQMAEITISENDDFQITHAFSNNRIDEFGEVIGEASKISDDEIEVLEIYEKFNKMKSIANKYRESRRWDWYLDYSKEFVEMSNYLVDFDDDFKGFSSYKGRVNLQNMTNEQLRTYYTWRTVTRNFVYKKTDYNYLLLYFNEIINNVGIKTYNEAIEMMLYIWRKYRSDFQQLDFEMPERLRDYYIVYSTKEKYDELVKMYPLNVTYIDENIKDLIENIYHNKLDYFDNLSTYSLKVSKFYHEDKKDLINSLIAYLFTKMDLLFKEKKFSLNNLLINKDHSDYWKPFIGDSFFYHKDQFAKKVVISELEIYDRQGASWHRESYSSITNNMFLGYVLKLMESTLRKFYNFKYKLHPSVTSLINKNVFSNKKLFNFVCSDELHYFIIDTVNTFLNVVDVKSREKRKIVFDSSKFAKIRKVSEELAEKLIIDEEEEIKVTEDKLDKYSLLEINLLKMILGKKSTYELNEYVLNHSEVLDLLIDDINSKALDIIGDNLVDVGETITIFEEYVQEALKIIKEHEQ